jgi:hypothetical protein
MDAQATKRQRGARLIPFVALEYCRATVCADGNKRHSCRRCERNRANLRHLAGPASISRDQRTPASLYFSRKHEERLPSSFFTITSHNSKFQHPTQHRKRISSRIARDHYRNGRVWAASLKSYEQRGRILMPHGQNRGRRHIRPPN